MYCCGVLHVFCSCCWIQYWFLCATLALLRLLLDAVLVCVLLWDDICLVWATLALLWLLLDTILVCVVVGWYMSCLGHTSTFVVVAGCGAGLCVIGLSNTSKWTYWCNNCDMWHIISYNYTQPNIASSNNHRSDNVAQIRHISYYDNTQTNSTFNTNHRRANAAKMRYTLSHNNTDQDCIQQQPQLVWPKRDIHIVSSHDNTQTNSTFNTHLAQTRHISFHNNTHTNSTFNTNHRSASVAQTRHISSHNNTQTNTASSNNLKSANVAQRNQYCIQQQLQKTYSTPQQYTD